MKAEYDFSTAFPAHVLNRTPIQMLQGVFYKRDDMYTPYGLHDVNGGKVRQAIRLLYPMREELKSKYAGVVTHTQVHSTTGTIIARVCKDLGIPCVICVGGSSPETLDNHHMMRYAKWLGADVRNVCGTGMHGPVLARMREIAKTENLFDAVFTHNVEYHEDAVIDSIERQVGNLPNGLDQLVIPVGSGVHFASVLRGLSKYQIDAKRIIGLCVGPKRTENINKWVNPLGTGYHLPEYELHCLNTVYGKPLVETLSDGTILDDLYEAKAHKWMRENLDITSHRTCFWIVGRRLSEAEVQNNMEGQHGNSTSTQNIL
jgi:1-aminocyclopropane-1-carboxylate deaminase/D-cysteine desulfhydrase-like pyridoxal-dependent ACC family enzyme